jgi:hypothetical protein
MGGVDGLRASIAKTSGWQFTFVLQGLTIACFVSGHLFFELYNSISVVSHSNKYPVTGLKT